MVHMPKLPPEQRTEVPELKTRLNVQHRHLVHCPHHEASRCSQPVGGTVKRWLAEEVDILAPQYCRPGGPAIANHLTRHDTHNQVSRRRVALMQGTEVQNKCAGNEVVRTDQTCISRNQRDTLWISCNIIYKYVVAGFCQNVKSTFCTVSRRFKFGIVYQFPPKTTTDEQFPRSTCCVRVFCYHISQLCRGMTPTYHRATLNETLFERKRFQARFLVFQAKTGGRRTSQGVVDTTTVHHQSSRNLSRFRLPVLQIQLSKQNFFQTQAYVDSFIIAVSCCLSFRCR